MEYISAEEFLKQPKEVQEVFRDWWKPSEGDLYASGYYNIKDDYETIHYGVRCIEYDMYRDMKEDEEWTIKEYVFQYASDIPLLTEGQIRKFIEDKTGCKIETVWCESGWHYNIDLVEKYDSCELVKRYYNLGENLLQAYWEVACEIAMQI